MTLGEYLRLHNVTQRHFAALIGRTPPTINGWLSGYRTPRLEDLLAIERLTEGAVTPQDFAPVQPRRAA